MKHYGPPGTGKTTRLLGVAADAHGRGESYLYATFSKATRDDALTKFGTIVHRRPKELKEAIRTLHSLAFEAAGHRPRDGTEQVATRHRKAWCDLVGLTFKPASNVISNDLPFSTTDSEGIGAEFFNALDACRHRGLDPRNPSNLSLFASTWNPEIAERAAGLVEHWAAWKAKMELWEQTDNIELSLEYGVSRSGAVFLVDEYQDLTPLLHRFALALAANFDRRHLAADDDQAIYTWAGGDASIFLDEPCDEEEVLGQSYRLPRRVWEASQRVIRQVERRKEKVFAPRPAEGLLTVLPRERFIDAVAARIVGIGSTLVLARTNYHVADLSGQLSAAGIAHIGIRGGLTIWDDKLRGACNAILRCRKRDPVPRAEIEALISMVPSRGALIVGGKARFAKTDYPDYPFSYVQSLFIDGGREPERHLMTGHRDAVRAYIERGTITDAGRIKVGTFHASKGLEADTVIVDSRLTNRILASACASRHGWDNELRVLYVALTRAKEELLILPTESRNTLVGAMRW